MKRAVWTIIIALSSGAVWNARAQSGRPAPVDWVTDGNDNQRTGWQRNETILTKKNVRNLKILWKIQTGNQVRALHSLMPVLIIGRLNTPNGPREVGIVNGISDNLYAFDVESGTTLWQKHWDYAAPAAAGGPPAAANPDPAHLAAIKGQVLGVFGNRDAHIKPADVDEIDRHVRTFKATDDAARAIRQDDGIAP